MGRLFGGFSQQVSESALRRWLDALREGADQGEALDIARRLGRLGPQAQEAAAHVVARLAGSEAELRRVLEDVEAWSRRHDLDALTHFLGALRARSSLPAPDDEDSQDPDR
jgi:hypothetical protein